MTCCKQLGVEQVYWIATLNLDIFSFLYHLTFDTQFFILNKINLYRKNPDIIYALYDPTRSNFTPPPKMYLKLINFQY